jgi:hypothetical protein
MQLPQSLDASPSLPCYDIDEIFANLTLEDLSPDRPRKQTRAQIPASYPSTPVKPKPKPSSKPKLQPSSPSTLYRISTPTQTRYTEHWSVWPLYTVFFLNF